MWSIWICQHSLRRRYIDIQPQIQSPWQTARVAAEGTQEPEPGQLGFCYFVTLPDGEGDIFTADTKPLLTLLSRNECSGLERQASRALAEARANGTSTFALCSSEAAAMSLGFFAFKEPRLRLLQVSASTLLQSQSPQLHPLGAFWYIGSKVLRSLAEQQKISLRVASWSMTLSESGPMQPHRVFRDALVSERLCLRKRKLMDEIVELDGQLEQARSRFQDVSQKLAKMDAADRLVPEESGR